MSRCFTLATKDLKALVRDKATMFWVLVFPLLIGILFGSIFGGSSGTSAIDVAMVDQDASKESQALAQKIESSKAVAAQSMDLAAAKDKVRAGSLAAYILIPKGYGDEQRRFQYSSGPAITLGIDPKRAAEAGMLQGVVSEAAYSQMSSMFASGPEQKASIEQNIQDLRSSSNAPNRQATIKFLTDLQTYMNSGAGSASGAGSFKFEGPKVATEPVTFDGPAPASPFEVTFPQAILWGLLGVISSFAISIVREHRQGTMARLQAAPLSFMEILGGKALACFMTCLASMTFLILLGHFLFHVRLHSPLLLALALFSGACSVVGIMMLLSVLGRTEQAVAGSSWGVMIIFSMFGGGMIPLFMMPSWMQAASSLSPLKWTVLSIEGATWRGFTFQEMVVPSVILIGIGIAAFSAGVMVMKKRAA